MTLLDTPFHPDRHTENRRAEEPTLDDLKRAAKAAGWGPGPNKRYRCGVHGGKDFNLAIYEGEDGKPHLSCKSHGCAERDIRRALEPYLETGYSYSHATTRPVKLHEDLPPGHVYTYHDAQGNEVSYVVRQDREKGKTFKQARPVNGHYEWKAMPGPRVLYGLPGIQANPGAPVAILEGEKCVDAYRARWPDQLATTNMGGSSQIRQTDWTPLTGRTVTIYSDADKPGRKWARQLADNLRALGCTVMLSLAQGDDGADIADWIADDTLEQNLVQPVPYGADTNAKPAQQAPDYTFLSEVETMQWQWQWKGWIPKGEIVLLFGRAKSGKGMVTCALCAMALGAKPWPDGTMSPEGGGVVWCGEEDDIARTLKRRTLAAGVPQDRFAVLNRPQDGNYAKTLLAQNPPFTDVRLIVVDPLDAGMKGNANDANDVRQHCEQWQAVARKYDCAVVGIRHIGKWSRQKIEETTEIMDMAQGSHQWSAVARANIALLKDAQNQSADRMLVFAGGNFDVSRLHDGYKVGVTESHEYGLRTDRFTPVADAVADAAAMLGGKATGNQIDDAIREVLREHGGECSSSTVKHEVHEREDVSTQYVGRRAADMKKRGELTIADQRPGKAGVWRLKT